MQVTHDLARIIRRQQHDLECDGTIRKGGTDLVKFYIVYPQRI